MHSILRTCRKQVLFSVQVKEKQHYAGVLSVIKVYASHAASRPLAVRNKNPEKNAAIFQQVY